MGQKHTIGELYQMQSLSLQSKIAMTRDRIKGWVDEYGEDGVYVSFSGGKDSTVLLHIARDIYPDMKAVFVDTGLEYPEIKQFVKSFDNVDIVRPKITFRQVLDKYGYPFISKEVSECVYGAKKFLSGGGWITSTENSVDLWNIPHANRRLKKLLGLLTKENQATTENIPSKDRSNFNCSRYNFFLEDGAPQISHMCCNTMKKSPAHAYSRKTGRKPITAQMASESRIRTQQWLLHGCNGFDLKIPTSNPMAFWTEQDVLAYILEYNITICSVYGEVVTDYEKTGQVDGQMSFSDFELFDLNRPPLKTTGCSRTGCVFCGFGCHLEKPGQGRFERLGETHEQLADYCMRGGAFDEEGIWKPDNRGLGMWYCIEWINRHGNLNIQYSNRKYYLETYMTEETRRYLETEFSPEKRSREDREEEWITRKQ